MKAKTKQSIWAITLLSVIVLFFATGCKPQHIITEKVIKVADSTAIVKLQTELSVKNKLIETLQLDLTKAREENTRLLSEHSSHTINYDTNAPVDPETGEHPKASETVTHSKYEYDKVVTENETLKVEHQKEVETLENEITDLKTTVQTLSQENSDLRTKATPAFNFKSFSWGIAAGIGLMILLFIFLRR